MVHSFSCGKGARGSQQLQGRGRDGAWGGPTFFLAVVGGGRLHYGSRRHARKGTCCCVGACVPLQLPDSLVHLQGALAVQQDQRSG